MGHLDESRLPIRIVLLFRREDIGTRIVTRKALGIQGFAGHVGWIQRTVQDNATHEMQLLGGRNCYLLQTPLIERGLVDRS